MNLGQCFSDSPGPRTPDSRDWARGNSPIILLYSVAQTAVKDRESESRSVISDSL